MSENETEQCRGKPKVTSELTARTPCTARAEPTRAGGGTSTTVPLWSRDSHKRHTTHSYTCLPNNQHHPRRLINQLLVKIAFR